MIRRVVVGVVTAVAACRPATGPQGTGSVRVATEEAKADTVRFDVPVVGRRCVGGGGVLVSGAQGGAGVLLLLRSAGSSIDTGTYQLLARADSASERGALVAIRYSVGPVSHGLIVDAGTARVIRAAPDLELAVRGHGVEAGTGGQRSAELALLRVALGPDSADCRVQP